VPEAEKYLLKSIELKPDFDEALNYLGYMWADLGTNLPKALEFIERAVKIEPDNPAYLDSLGWVLFKLGKPKEAVAPLEKAVQLSPEPDAAVLDHLGDALLAANCPEDAREAWRKSLAAEKNDAVQRKLDALDEAAGSSPITTRWPTPRRCCPACRPGWWKSGELQKAQERAGERNAELFAEGRDLGGERINDHLRSLAELHSLLAKFQSREIQLKDLDRGLLDFPPRADREVLLCWEEGEDDIEFRHDLETGYAGRERLVEAQGVFGFQFSAKRADRSEAITSD
jgi:hypothetical protein